jgi:predicted transcriptional regulator
MPSDNIELLVKKNKRNILIAAKNGSINSRNVAQFMNLDPEDADKILDKIYEDGSLDRKNNPLPGGGYFHSYIITPSGISWIKTNIARKYKVLMQVNDNGPVSPPSVASAIGSSLSYASNTLRRLWAEGLISRVSDKKHAYIYKVTPNGVKRLDWIEGNTKDE